MLVSAVMMFLAILGAIPRGKAPAAFGKGKIGMSFPASLTAELRFLLLVSFARLTVLPFSPFQETTPL